MIDYPTLEVTDTFKVRYRVSDECDDRLITEGVLTQKPVACIVTSDETISEEVE